MVFCLFNQVFLLFFQRVKKKKSLLVQSLHWKGKLKAICILYILYILYIHYMFR